MGDADGVADRDFVGAELQQPLGQIDDARRIDGAFERTAKAGGQIGAHAQARLQRRVGDLADRRRTIRQSTG